MCNLCDIEVSWVMQKITYAANTTEDGDVNVRTLDDNPFRLVPFDSFANKKEQLSVVARYITPDQLQLLTSRRGNTEGTKKNHVPSPDTACMIIESSE